LSCSHGRHKYIQCCGSGSGIRCLFGPLDPAPGSRIGSFRISDSGSQTHDKFLGKKFYNSLKTCPNFFLQHFKNKIIYNFVKFVAITTKFHPSLLLLFLDPRSGMCKRQDPGSGIHIPDPQH
jgi:hypothetical protein